MVFNRDKKEQDILFCWVFVFMISQTIYKFVYCSRFREWIAHNIVESNSSIGSWNNEP